MKLEVFANQSYCFLGTQTEADFTNHFFFPVIEFSGVFPLPTPPMINKKEKKNIQMFPSLRGNLFLVLVAVMPTL